MTLTVVPSTREHAEFLAPRLREADRQEIAAASGRAPLEALLDGLRGDVCLTAISPEGRPVLMGGVYPDRQDPEWAGQIWMLCTDELLEHRLEFLRRARLYLGALDNHYRLLWNVVDARNTTHIRWIGWMGFTFIRRIPQYGAQRRPFYEFVRITSHV